MFNYSTTLIVTNKDGEQFNLTQCRINNGSKLFTKNTEVKVDEGDKISQTYSDGSIDLYVVLNVKNKKNLLGSREFQIQRL